MLLPTDNAKICNFLNFRDLGKSRERPYTAFANTQRFSKTYKTNLVHLPSTFTDKYVKLNSLFNNEASLNTSTSYSMTRQHNLTSVAAVLNNNAAFLDQKSFNKFLTYTMQHNSQSHFMRPSARLFTPYQVTHQATLRSLNMVALAKVWPVPTTSSVKAARAAHTLTLWAAHSLRSSHRLPTSWTPLMRVHYPLNAATSLPALREFTDLARIRRSRPSRRQ